MADKLIPGIPHVSRISILQQTGIDDESGGYGKLRLDSTVLDAVLGSDETKNEITRTVGRMADRPMTLHLDTIANPTQFCQKASTAKTPSNQ